MAREDERRLGTADFARAGEPQQLREPVPPNDPMDRVAQDLRGDAHAERLPQEDPRMHAEPLAELFQARQAEDFRQRWDGIQIGFVDDPRAAVRNADELVAEVLRSLAESFAQQRSQIEAGLDGQGRGDTENMRIALQRYRAFFQRLLSL